MRRIVCAARDDVAELGWRYRAGRVAGGLAGSGGGALLPAAAGEGAAESPSAPSPTQRPSSLAGLRTGLREGAAFLHPEDKKRSEEQS